MNNIANLLIAQFKLYQIDMNKRFIEEITEEVVKMSQKYVEINSLNYNYLHQEEKVIHHVLQDGTNLTIDNLEWTQTDDYTIVVMYLNNSSVKNMFYVIDPAYIEYIIKETIFLFLIISKTNSQLSDESIEHFHHIIVATLIAMCALAKYDMGTEQFHRMMKVINMNTICITLCCPLIDILKNSEIYSNYLI